MSIRAEISYDEFSKLDIRVGLIKSAEMVPETDKLIKCIVDFGEEIGDRTIVSGIRQWHTPEELIGKRLPYLINLAPRELRGVLSEGMLLAAAPINQDGQRGLALMELSDGVSPGTSVG